MAEPMIRLKDVSKTFPGTDAPAVTGLSLDVPRGAIAVLVGPSGCGKTTTLKMINRLIEPTSGSILVDGRDVTGVDPAELRRGIGYVIQQIGLFPHRTIAENIATVPNLLGWDKERIAERVDQLIDVMGLDATMLARYPSELSGGQRQRVGVARALAADPPVLLMDEPFGAVDPIVRARLQIELLQLQEKLHKTIVLVTHDIDEAIRLGDRVAILNVGGILEQYGPPEEILRHPAGDFVVEFLGAERGLKRLSLIPITQLELEPGPVVDIAARPSEAKAAMDGHGVNWFGLVDGERLLGWAWDSDLVGADDLHALAPRRFNITLTPRSTLREALDAIVTSRTQVAVVVEEGRYLGMLSGDHLNEALLA